MTVIFSKKCELALQSILFLSVQPKGNPFNAGEIANHLKIPKEFVAKVLQAMKKHKIVDSKKGKTGGFFLAKEPKEIRLIDVVIAIDGLEVFHKCVLGFPGCTLEKPCPLHEKWGPLRDMTYNMLSEETLEGLSNQTRIKIDSIK